MAGAGLGQDAWRGEGPEAARDRRLALVTGSRDSEAQRRWALKALGLQGLVLPGTAERQANFERFAALHFPKRPPDSDEFDQESYGPEPGTPLYGLWAAYALTDYGAAKVAQVLAEAGQPPLVVKAVPGASPQAWEHLMVFPPDFPRPGARFRFGGQEVDPLAVLHHEFEHTRYGRLPNREDELLAEELFTVREVENPVRVLNGLEPRYTYTQLDPEGRALRTIAVLPPHRQAEGAWTFDPHDPSRLVPWVP